MEKKVLIPFGRTLREFVIKTAMVLCIAQTLTAYFWKSILEKTLCILTRKVTVIYVVPVEFLTLVSQGSI